MPDNGTILVLPGGGYHLHAAHEAEPVAEWLESLGWRARVVRYPVLAQHPIPLAAARAEIRAERAAGAGLVGLLGFSAGGHLAGHAALAPDSSPEERADFAVLGYPVTSMVVDPHLGSRAALLGPEHRHADAVAVSLETLVTPASPPLFLWHTAEDASVPVSHTYRLGERLAASGVPHEVHVFAGDVHGIGLGEGTAASAWTTLCANWLERVRNIAGPRGVLVP
ncbi:alpha/beta hydrolase [Microbacterium sp. P05]|uniref:alpha/beta hydrolase n=1 Tax=Microbacterium sp. P05 TaxID=3366948 RepID=UPI0037465EDF